MATKDANSIILDFLTQTKFRLWRHVLFIILFLPIALSMSFSVFSGHIDVLGNKIYLFGACLAILPISFVYFNLKILIPRYFAKNRYGTYIAYFLICMLLFLTITYLARYHILTAQGIKQELNIYAVLDGLSNFILYTICIASSSVTAMLQQWTNDTNKIDNLENTWLKNSLDELKNRINPKFLYGILDYSSETVKTKPEKASVALLKLSELLRYELYDCKRERVLLKSDIQFIDNYLSLEQQNLENKFTYTISVMGSTNYFLTPFIFMPFVQEVMMQKPLEIVIGFKIQEELIHFSMNVIGIDLSECNFQKVEQKLALLYSNNFSINRDKSSLILILKKI